MPTMDTNALARRHMAAQAAGTSAWRHDNTFAITPGFQFSPNPMVPSSFMTDTSLLAHGQPPGQDSALFQMLSRRRGQETADRFFGGGLQPWSGRHHSTPFVNDFFSEDPFAVEIFCGRSDPLQQMMSCMTTGLAPNGNFRGESGGMFQSSVMMMTSTVGPDGKPRVERYMKTSRGNMEQQMREVREAYSNSHTGLDKMGVERELRGRGMRTLRERNRHTENMVQNEEPINMNEGDIEAFEKEWRQHEGQYLPPQIAARRHGASSHALQTAEHGSGPSSRRQLPQYATYARHSAT